MAYNLVQFQHGMSLPDFIQCFGTERADVDELKPARWPAGFVSPRCGGSARYFVGSASRGRFQCNARRVQTLMTADILFAGIKLPLTTWLLAIHLLRQARTSLSALAAKRHIGGSYPTAWLIHRKVMKTTADLEAAHRLRGAA